MLAMCSSRAVVATAVEVRMFRHGQSRDQGLLLESGRLTTEVVGYLRAVDV
jgi:hypothetical protein